jgi:hypothetical protein
MKSIYKYTVEPFRNKLEFSGKITKILTAQIQRGKICVWAEVNSEVEEQHYFLYPIGTGWSLDEIPEFDKFTYLSTVQEFDGDLVWHLYYRKK